MKKSNIKLGSDIVITGHGVTFVKKGEIYHRGIPIKIEKRTKKGKSTRLLVMNFNTVDRGTNWKEKLVLWLVKKVYFI